VSPYRCAVLVLSLVAVACTKPAESPPNIVLIISDDLGWPYHGFMTSPAVLETTAGSMAFQEVVETPNLDRLATEGVTFTRGYNTASTCVRSLRTYLSAQGLYPSEWGSQGMDLGQIPALAPVEGRTESRYMRTLPRELARRGYASWEGGKMWEGTFEDAGFTDGLATAVGPWGVVIGQALGRDGWDLETCGSTAREGARCEALNPLRQFLDDSAGRPWFVWFAPMLPHAPLNAPVEYRRRYRELGLPRGRIRYLANVRWLDELVGELLSELERRGLRDDTIVIYASDNGFGVETELLIQTKGKATLYDQGHRTPLIVRWPGHVPPGLVYDGLVSTADIPATILDYAGLPPIPGARGTSLRPWIEGRAGPPREMLFTHSLGDAVVTDEWRYLRFPDGREELYRIDTDPLEAHDLAGEEPATRRRLARAARRHKESIRHPTEEVEVVGQLLDDETGGPAAGIQLKLSDGSGARSWLTTTEQDGWFHFDPVPPGDDYTIEQTGAGSAGPLCWATTGRALDGGRPIVAPGVFHPLRTSCSTAGVAEP